MNTITIPELSIQMSQDKRMTEVGTAILAKTLDQMEAGSAGMVDMMSRSMMEQSVNPNLGGNVDIMI